MTYEIHNTVLNHDTHKRIFCRMHFGDNNVSSSVSFLCGNSANV